MQSNITQRFYKVRLLGKWRVKSPSNPPLSKMFKWDASPHSATFIRTSSSMSLAKMSKCDLPPYDPSNDHLSPMHQEVFYYHIAQQLPRIRESLLSTSDFSTSLSFNNSVMDVPFKMNEMLIFFSIRFVLIELVFSLLYVKLNIEVLSR